MKRQTGKEMLTDLGMGLVAFLIAFDAMLILALIFR